MYLILLSAGKFPIKSFEQIEVGILAAKNPSRSGYRKQTIFFVWPNQTNTKSLVLLVLLYYFSFLKRNYQCSDKRQNFLKLFVK